MGYVPLRREDGRPFVVCIREATSAVVDRIRPGSRVNWGRDEGRGESVWIMERTTGAEWRHYYPDTPPRADLVPWLVRLWRMPDLQGPLTEWFREECQPTVTEALPAPVAPVVVTPAVEAPDPKLGMTRQVGEEYDRVLESINRKTRRMKSPETNGAH